MSGITFAAEQPGSQTMRAAAMSNVTIANATEGSLQALVDQKLGGGIRVIDGQTIYTKWSNKAYRIAK